MEFDASIQSRWKLSLGCFAAGAGAFAILGLTRAAWGGLHWVVGALICMLGVMFAVLSLAAGEHRRVMGWLTLLLNLVLPGILALTLFSLFR